MWKRAVFYLPLKTNFVSGDAVENYDEKGVPCAAGGRAAGFVQLQLETFIVRDEGEAVTVCARSAPTACCLVELLEESI
ncbi:MAG: hypothetical protein ABI461_01510 [Polyangiaceae bacterium]